MMRTQRQGFVLIAALWLLVALSAVSLDAALRSKARRIPAANILDDGRARQAALAGAEYARSRLTAALSAYNLQLRAEAQRNQTGARTGAALGTMTRMPAGRAIAQADNPWRDPAQLMQSAVAVGDVHFLLDVHDTGVALNINLASESMLRDFLTQGMRVDFITADRLAQEIMDWRDQDEIARANGGEREEYLDADAVVLPANQPFAEVDDLRHVMSMTPELLEELRPYVTVIGTGRINVNAAPEQVLAALPGITTAHAAQLIRLRDAGYYPASLAELRSQLGMSGNLTAAETREFNNRVSYATAEVAIVTEGYIEGSPVRARVTTIVRNATNRAVVVWRKVE